MKPIRIFGLVIQSQASYDTQINAAYKEGHELSLMRLHPGQMIPCNYPKAFRALAKRDSYDPNPYYIISSLGLASYAEKCMKDKAI